jgi:phage tail sheath protein FI
MPEYLAPGVYIEETSFRAKTIEGLSTSTAGFVGPTRFGPIRGEPELLTSFSDFERIYGGLDRLEYSGTQMDNFMAHAVRAFFENGGRRLYVSRVYKTAGSTDGIAFADITDGESPPSRTIHLQARYPGAAGNITVNFLFHIGQNILGSVPIDPGTPGAGSYPVLRGAGNYDVVWVKDVASPITSPPGSGMLFWLDRYFDENNNRYTFRLRRDNPDQEPVDFLELTDPSITEVRIVTVDVTIGPLSEFGHEETFGNLSFHPEHRRALGRLFAPEANADRATSLFIPLVFSTELKNGVDIAETLLMQPGLIPSSPPRVLLDTFNDPNSTDAARTFQIILSGGSDGDRPEASDYEGDDGNADGLKSGLRAFEDIEDISIVSAPGSSFDYRNDLLKNAETIISHLISHCQRMRYRIAVLDSADTHLVSEIRAYRGKIDSSHAALYYPWVRILDPVTDKEINVPPSGFVAGIYARNDVENGVHKAPANEVVRLAIGFEFMLNKAQQDVLNPEGINCFRFFEGRGYRLWGARTASSDPEWKYVNLRRYFAFIEHSIEKGTQWVVFENNSGALWTKVRHTIEDFLFNEWKSRHLMGEKPQEAYFVRCDRSTMTQNDIDNGRLVCLIGIAPVRPAEFVIFRIGQWTANRRA